MKKVHLLIALAISVVFAACSSSKEATGVYVNKEKLQGKTFTSLFIVVLTADIEARAKLETDLAAAATLRGLKATKSIDVMPSTLKDPRVPTKEEFVSALKSSGADGVLVASLLNKEEDIKFSPGSTTYSQNNYFTYTSYYGYYSNWHASVVKPDYYNHDKKYILHSNLFDAASEELMWAVDSEVMNPSNINAFSKSYTTTLVTQLQKSGLIKK